MPGLLINESAKLAFRLFTFCMSSSILMVQQATLIYHHHGGSSSFTPLLAHGADELPGVASELECWTSAAHTHCRSLAA